MYDLGFPVDCIEAVKDLYTDAETAFILPSGETGPIKIERGTIQGDSLSPLFLIFLEPLLRWLHTGGLGYALKSLQGDGTKVSSLAYADDLCAMTSSHKDLILQAKKIEDFGKWVDSRSIQRNVQQPAHCTQEAGRTHLAMISAQAWSIA